ncbi:hypothetical protein MKZ38_009837 [Zalerion maritima]|uniref:J domain-containing protein n=1 Tax=Zalerion maritima TaxID=339359 RepID=A0AAD5S669_9PEZI|nr:hypothetical protein MKZ38_009837 [Zalerion maritima]
MPPASTTGADAGGSGSARHREHNQGNQERKATPDQIAAVVRIRRCDATAFYDILSLESVRSTCTEADIKKAYRKQSLLTHPDKNGHEHADEAFKMVARAFSILGDKEKRQKYDKFGGDPDSRFGGGAGGGGAGGGNPFAGFGGRRAASGGGGFPPNMWEEELSPEELFNRFFGGGGGAFGGPFGAFDTGPQFVFNMGGGPGVRVHQFGGPRPRTRPRNPGQQDPENTLRDMIIQLLPLIVLFLLPIITNLFGAILGDPSPSGSSSGVGNHGNAGSNARMNSGPKMVFDEADPEAGFTEQRQTDTLHIDYFMQEQDVEGLSNKKLYDLDRNAEVTYMKKLRDDCMVEQAHKRDLSEQAQGWFFQDDEKMEVAIRYETPSCARYEQFARVLR